MSDGLYRRRIHQLTASTHSILHVLLLALTYIILHRNIYPQIRFNSIHSLVTSTTKIRGKNDPKNDINPAALPERSGTPMQWLCAFFVASGDAYCDVCAFSSNGLPISCVDFEKELTITHGRGGRL